MPNPLAGTDPVANLEKGLEDNIGDDFGQSKLKSSMKWLLILASIVGILSALGIFYQILPLNLGFEVPIGVENLGILAGVCAFICGLDTLWNVFKKRSEL